MLVTCSFWGLCWAVMAAAPGLTHAAPAVKDTGRATAPPPLLDTPPTKLSGPGGAALDQGPDENLLPGAQVLPLDAIMRHARDSAMRVRVAKSRLEMGDAAVAGAKPLMVDNPQLYAGMGTRTNTAGTNFEFQSTLTQPFEFGGERGLRIKAGRRYRELLDKELAQIQWETYAQVHYAYNMALLARARAQTAERTAAFSARLLEVATRRAQAGEISNLRVRVATGELAQARQNKLNADLEYRLACIHLSEMAGWPPPQLVAPVGVLEAPVRVRDAAELLAKVQAEHPALKAREAAVELGESRKLSAQRDRLAEPQLGIYLGREYEPSASTGPSRVAMGMITVPLPLWKRNQAARAQTKAELTVAEQELEATRYTLGISVRRAVDSVTRWNETLLRLPAKSATGCCQPNGPVRSMRLFLMSMARSTRWRLPPGDGREPGRTLRNSLSAMSACGKTKSGPKT